MKRRDVICLLLSCVLAACSSSSSKPYQSQNVSSAVVEPSLEADSKQAINTTAERRSPKKALSIPSICLQNAHKESDVMVIRECVQKDLTDAGLSEQEISKELARYDLKTCGLR